MKIEIFKKKDSSELVELLLSADPDKACVNRYINTGEILTAIIDDKVVGVAVVVMNGVEAELKNIAVRPMEQGKGIAKDLIDEVKKLAKRLGATFLIVGTGNSSLSQLALYQKCGFRFYRIIPNFFETYSEPIFENGIRCIDMVMLKFEL
tara:strand:- start:44 stop:493 length:450 start_codon:yes stop_codon:yes gene_type:complete